MVLPIRLCAAHCGAPLLLMGLLMAGLPLTASADTPAQRQDIAAAARQLDALERLVAHSAANTTVTPGERYHFDYVRLRADLARVRAGLQDFLAPPRAQPRDPAELAGQYRTEQAADQSRDAEPKP
ncbi:TPA: RAQPRD family integrative conjugative element protein [Pseudomonas aeruginosa]|uniref:integrative conjugative element protein, RAQPRD family n=1 Tax=Gammaproteobacteria TaxID=1236 RepID=UPI000447A4F0|nr:MULTISPECIES: RAQPRD family integrative conjugative element protein [Gammaproteobacteria]AMG43378.1 RAQPRD family plasmid [Achromobacter xylosoxidans]HBT5887523.1 RAQPRD family plasmid [Klebsiella quasipneumoniae]HCI6318463.1 RAQPRD family integrative conjugative element protein [Klebsiella quasipneumoniae subsp. similipneumoniae]HCL2787035.1 RAQPRD family integrative conjugative element protein [Pseudomonas aeruginosa 1BAE]HDS0938038.1 RAQPRD family integrative conjugative element protein 